MLPLLLCLLLSPPQDNAALKDRVNHLFERLTTAKPEERTEAEKSLIELGPRALPLLPTAAPESADEDAQARLERVRNKLEEVQEKEALTASRVTIQGEALRLTEVLRELQRQSGNRITDLREIYGAEATNPALDLNIQDKPFFEALDEIARQAEVVPNFFTGDGSVGLMPGTPERPDQPAEPPKAKPLIRYTGPFRVEFKRIAATRDLATGMGQANAQFEIAWEPRLRPMLLALKSEKVAIVDDRGETVPPDVMAESSDVVLRPENPVVEVNLNMEAPDREAKSLKTLKVEGDVTIPAGLKQFRFPRLDAKNVTRKQGEIKITLLSSEVEENVWKIRLKLEMPGQGPAFESYQQGLFNNRLWLQRPDGSRFEHNGGFSNTAYGPGELGFEYLFVDVPGKPTNYTLIYETPSRVVSIPLQFQFEDVPLP